MTKHIIFGAAGTGKTFHLVNKTMPELFNAGYRPEDICFCSFTKAAANEAKERTVSVYGFPEDNLIYFATIHSICYKRMCIGKQVITAKQKKSFFDELQVDYMPMESDEDLLTNETNVSTLGNIALAFYDKLRLFFCKSITEFKEDELKGSFFQLGGSLDYDTLFAGTTNVYNLLKEYEIFKFKNNLIDFIDMLLIAYKVKFIIPTKILIIDEFQDLSPLQYEIYKIWCRGKDRVYLAGDDNQAIYGFIEANAKFLLHEREILDKHNGDTELILPKTYRMHKKIHDYCQEYVKHINSGHRVHKDVEAVKEGGEIIEEYIDEDIEKVLDFIRPNKFTYVLFRTNYYKKLFIQEVLIPKGIIYHEIRGISIWNSRTINLFNACIKLITKKPLDLLEVKYLIENIPFNLGLLKRGAKSEFKSKNLFKDSYTLADLFTLGFSSKLFDFVNDYDNLYRILDINDNLKKTFDATPKQIIKPPIRLKIGTIHSSKGKECDDCIIFKDVPKRIASEIASSMMNYEAEIRVFYVGQSRPKERLVILRNGFRNSECDIIP